MRRIFLTICIGILFMAAARPASGQKKTLTLGFDGLPDLSLNVDDFGVDFTGAQVLACGGSLNCGPFPPFSGANVIFDQPGFGGVITAVFDTARTGKVTRVSARVTGNRNVTMTAFGAQGQVLGSAQTGGVNFVGSGTGIPANKLLEVTTTTDGITRVTFRDSGNTYTVDNFSFDAAPKTVVIDPGHGQLRVNGVLTFQRSPTPTFALIEDVLTLEISRSVKTLLEADDVTVHLTRSTNEAPFAPPDCGNPCIPDINKRVRFAEKLEPDLLVSVHTNGGPPTANGSEALFWTVAPAPNSKSLAQFVLSRVVALGLTNRGVKQEDKNILRTSMPSALIEAAFHSNSQLGKGRTITDEELLNDPAFRLSIARAISNGIKDYYADIEK